MWRKNPDGTWNSDDLKASVVEEFKDVDFPAEVRSLDAMTMTMYATEVRRKRAQEIQA